MYRALSTQLRILLCDSPKPLLTRLFSNLEIQRLQPLRSYQPGDFPPESAHLNDVAVSGPGEYAICCMPFEARVYINGVEDCLPLLDASGALLPLDQWLDQLVSVEPVPVTIRQVIKTVADRGGGAHVHKSKDALLSGLQGISPGRLHLAAMVVIAVSKVMQQFGIAVNQHYEKHGAESGLPLAAIDRSHPSFIASARVPDACLSSPYQAFNLLSVRRI